MISDIFVYILNMSLSAVWLILAVMLIRLVFKKMPKKFRIVLWGIVAVRLVCPNLPGSPASLVPSSQVIAQGSSAGGSFIINSGISAVDIAADKIVESSVLSSVNTVAVTDIFSYIWIAVSVGILIYTVVSYFMLKRKVGTAVLFNENVYECDNVSSPFVFGLIKPKIYLPFNISPADRGSVILHENAHIRRRDHITKTVGFLITAVHWFNPFVILSFILLCRDIELACDESIVINMDKEQRSDYMQALFDLSVGKNRISICPLSFGEVTVKERIKSVMNGKKPAKALLAVCVALCVITGACFLTDRYTRDNMPDKLKTAVDFAVLSDNDGKYLEGEFKTVSSKILGVTRGIRETKVYALCLYDEWTAQNGLLYSVSGSFTPVAMTFKNPSSANAPYVLKSYETPSDGTMYSDSIKRIFPVSMWGQVLYMSDSASSDLHENSRKNALEYFGLDENTPEHNLPFDYNVPETTIAVKTDN